MKVLVDARGLLEEVKAGVEGYTYNMLVNLQRMYPQDEYILFSYSRTKQPPDYLSKNFQWKHFFWSNILTSISFRLLDYPVIDGLVGEFDWVWFPNIRFFPVSKKIKKVVTVHDLSFEIMPDCYSLKRRLWHWHMNIRNNLLTANKVVCVSDNTKRDLLELYKLSKNKVATIYPGVPKLDTENKRRIRDKKYIVYLGTLEERKNILNLLKAYEYYVCKLSKNPLPMVLIGGDCLTWDINKYLWTQKLHDKVTVGGYLDDQSRDKILAEAALVVYPSFYEGFGFPPLEALQRNIPVLTSFGGSLGEILKDNGLIFDPLDYKTMGINILQILEIKNWQPKNSFDHDLAQFDWKKSAQSFRELLVS